MKKFLIGVIFLIPIVVVVALSATGTIIGLTTSPNPSDIIIKNSENEVITKDSKPIRVDYRDDSDFLIIDVLPAIVKEENKEIEYEADEEAGEGKVELERMGNTNRYRIIPKKIGVTKLVINPKANVSVYKEVTIHVTSDTIESIVLYDENGADVGRFRDVITGERFYADIYPVDALHGNEIVWTSSNDNVAEVNQNGLVTVKGFGDSRIKATVTDKDGNTISAEVDINTRNAIASSNVVYTTIEVVDEVWVLENVALSATDTEIENASENRFKLIRDGKEMVVEVVTVEDEIGFIDLPEVVYTRNGGYLPTIGNVVTGEVIEGAIIEVSDATTLQIEEVTGLLVPQKAGEVTVKATIGGTQIEKVITVRENPIAFELQLSNADGKLGIQRSRTWGYYFLDENLALTNRFFFGLADKSNAFDVVWSVSNPEYATITHTGVGQEIIIGFNPQVCGDAVTVTATVKVNNRLMSRVKRSFTFNVRKEKNTINAYDFAQVKWISEHRYNNLVLQNDIEATEKIEAFCGSIYGNGFKYDGTRIASFEMDEAAIQMNYEDFMNASRRPEWAEAYATYVSEGNDQFNFEDIVMFNANSIEESGDRGSALKVRGLWDETRPCFDDFTQDPRVNIKYMQVYNTNRGIELGYLSDCVVEGCILGDNGQHSMFIYYYNEDYRRWGNNTLTLRNNVFKISSGPSVMLASVPVGDALDSKVNIAPHLKIEGFMDVYNWKTQAEFITAISNLIGGYLAAFVPDPGLMQLIDTLLMPVLETVIEEISNDGEFQDSYYTYAGTKYVSLGLVGLGALFTFDASLIEITGRGVMLTDLPFRNSEGKTIGTLASLESTFLALSGSFGLPYVTTVSNPSALVCADFSQGEPEIDPGDPVPNSKELYSKLLNGE